MAKKTPKRTNRPAPEAFRAGAARLDHINSMASKRKVPAIIDLSSDSEEPTAAIKKPPATQPKSHVAADKTVRRRSIVQDSEDEGALPLFNWKKHYLTYLR
jgi:hypothetical protein